MHKIFTTLLLLLVTTAGFAHSTPSDTLTQKQPSRQPQQRSISDTTNLDKVLNIGGTQPKKIEQAPVRKTTPVPAPNIPQHEIGYRVDDMSSFSLLAGNNALGWTVTYYLGDPFNLARIALPLTVSGEYIYNLNSRQSEGYQTSSIYYGKVGVELFYPLNRYFWLNGGVQIPLGNELLADHNGNNRETPIVGLSLTQSIRVMSEGYSGISVAIGLFEQVMTAKSLPFNVGARIELGFKF